jgi:hypothetical protein
MRPWEVAARLAYVCDILDVGEWRDGVVRRCDYTLDELCPSSPAPEKIPHFYLDATYKNGGALFLSGKKPAEGEKRKKPASRALVVYDKTVQLTAQLLEALSTEKGDDISCVCHMWRVEYRFSTRAACAKIGLSTVEDALTGLLVWDAIAPETPCAMLPEVFSLAWKRIRTECSSLAEARMLCARLRASLRGLPGDRPRKDIIAAEKGGERCDRGYCGERGKDAEDYYCSPEREPLFAKGGEGIGGGGDIIRGGGGRGIASLFFRARGPPPAPPTR